MTAGEVCKRNVATVARRETVVEAANHMRAFHVGDLVVVEDRQSRRVPIGIITDRDIVVGAVAPNSGHINSLLVGDIMSSELVTAREHEPLEAALKKMEEHGIRRLPVVDGDGSLVGILTLDDALEVLTEQQIGLVKVVAQEQRTRAAVPSVTNRASPTTRTSAVRRRQAQHIRWSCTSQLRTVSSTTCPTSTKWLGSGSVKCGGGQTRHD